MRLFPRHMARQLRYVMELGFDACFRFYQFPVTRILCSRLARCVPYPVSVSDETLITSCFRCHGFFSRDIGFTVRRYMTRSGDGHQSPRQFSSPYKHFKKLNYKLFYANSTNDLSYMCKSTRWENSPDTPRIASAWKKTHKTFPLWWTDLFWRLIISCARSSHAEERMKNAACVPMNAPVSLPKVLSNWTISIRIVSIKQYSDLIRREIESLIKSDGKHCVNIWTVFSWVGFQGYKRSRLCYRAASVVCLSSVRNVLWLNCASWSKSYYWQPIGSRMWRIDWYQNAWPWPLFRGHFRSSHRLSVTHTVSAECEMSAFGRPLVCERSYATLQHLSKLLNFYQTHSLPRLASLFFKTKLKRGYEINGISSLRCIHVSLKPPSDHVAAAQ